MQEVEVSLAAVQQLAVDTGHQNMFPGQSWPAGN